jgi:hypothetical protein
MWWAEETLGIYIGFFHFFPKFEKGGSIIYTYV